MSLSRSPSIILVLFLLPIDARAERPPQDRKAAPIALTGRVEAVEKRSEGEMDYYKISVRIEQIERGPDLKPGELFVVTCFRWARPTPGYVGASGHTSFPNKGDKIHMFAWPRGSDFEGNYPNWYDLIETTPAPAVEAPRQPVEQSNLQNSRIGIFRNLGSRLRNR